MSGLSRRNDTCKAYFRTTYGLRPRCAPSPRQNHPSVSTVPGSRLADSTNAVGLCDENNARLRRTDPRLYSCRVHTAPPVNCSLVRQPCLSTTSFPCDCRALTVLRGIRIHNEGTPPRSNPKRSETSSAWDASPSEEPIQAPERSRSGIASGSAPSSAATSVSGPVREAACRDLEDSSSCLPLRSALRAVLARKRRMAATCPHAPIVEAAQEG